MRLSLACLLVALLVGCAPTLNAPVTLSRLDTAADLGAGQGAAVHAGFIYLYGDAETGVIREYTLAANPRAALVPTGRVIRCTRDGVDIAPHPTGLTWHPQHGCYLGSTVRRRGTILHLDWPRALADGNLDNAVLATIDDDAAVNGTRPEFVRHAGRWLLATSDYGDDRNAVRYLDPAILATAPTTSTPGVVVESHPCPPWVQNLHWDDRRQRLTLVLNQIEGRRWRLAYVTNTTTPDYRPSPTTDYPSRPDELEGWTVLPPGHFGVFITSSRGNNIGYGLVK